MLICLLVGDGVSHSSFVRINDKGYFTDHQGHLFFPIGLNYWPASTGLHLWDADYFPVSEIRHNMQVIRKDGFNSVRIFIMWSSFEPHPGVMNETVVQNLVDMLKICVDEDLYVNVSVFVGWMSGQLIWPSWKTRNMFTDPYTRKKSLEFAQFIAKTVKPFASNFAGT